MSQSAARSRVIGEHRRHGKKHRQRQVERQRQRQRQHLMRDFTLAVTPFQKNSADSRALPYNQQKTGATAADLNSQRDISPTTAAGQSTPPFGPGHANGLGPNGDLNSLCECGYCVCDCVCVPETPALLSLGLPGLGGLTL